MEEMSRWARAPKRVRHIFRGTWVSRAIRLVYDFRWTIAINWIEF